jgi:uncharacterized membrane protein YsdA (DUF1294 family)
VPRAAFLLAALTVFVLCNLVTWSVYRLDKARARRGRRRVSERALLTLAAVGGSLGALAGVYAHRQRHKAQKRRFMAWLWAIVAAQLALVAGVVARMWG